MKRICFLIIYVSLMFSGIARAEVSDKNAELIQAAATGSLTGVDAALIAGGGKQCKDQH